jgi:hypothetical protein
MRDDFGILRRLREIVFRDVPDFSSNIEHHDQVVYNFVERPGPVLVYDLIHSVETGWATVLHSDTGG